MRLALLDAMAFLILRSTLSSAVLVSCGLALPIACGEVAAPSGSTGTVGAGGSGATTTGATTTGAGGAPLCEETPPPAPPMDVCARVIAGDAGKDPISHSLSVVHSVVRFFAPIPTYQDADQALAVALDAPDALTAPDLTPYAAALPDVVCALPASAATLGPMSVEMVGDVALVHPGTGPLTLPEGTRAVAVDLRGIPDVLGTREAVEAAVAPALASPVPRAQERVRRHHGMTDELFSATNVYDTKVALLPQFEIPKGGGVDLPLAFLTDARTAPSAAEIAITLRLAGRAYIEGEDLLSGVAEMRWIGVGTTGVDVRPRVLRSKAGVWPDVIPADHRSSNPECWIADLATRGAPPPSPAKGVSRPDLEQVDPFDDQQPPEVTLGTARAALVIAHGALRVFFPYFPTVGDVIDERLEETLGALGPGVPTRAEVQNSLRRFGNAISDGHQFVFDFGGPPPAGYLPIFVEDINGLPVVRRSLAVGVAPGDTITSIGGVPALQWYLNEFSRTSAASDGYRFNIATRRYLALDGPISLGIHDADGVNKTILFQPQPFGDYQAVGFTPTLRPAGFLGDLGAPDLYYLNMASEVLASDNALHVALTAASSAKGMVVDMRGYPGINHYEAAQRLIPASCKAPTFNVTTVTGLDQRDTKNEGGFSLPPLANPSFAGPIVLLVGHATVSAAENFSLLLVDAQRVKVMGRRSAATNGNITGVQLPGAFGFSFTGMEVRHGDAAMSPFHGIGIVPDTESILTAEAFRDGIDPELQDAIAWLLTP